MPPPRHRHCERRAPRGRVRVGRRRCCGAANKEEEPRREVGREDPRGRRSGCPLLPAALVGFSVLHPRVPAGAGPAASLPLPAGRGSARSPAAPAPRGLRLPGDSRLLAAGLELFLGATFGG